LDGENFFVGKTLVSSSQDVLDPGGIEWSHVLALFLSEKGNKCRWIASVEASLIFNVSRPFRKIERYKLGSSIDEPLSWDCCTMDVVCSS